MTARFSKQKLCHERKIPRIYLIIDVFWSESRGGVDAKIVKNLIGRKKTLHFTERVKSIWDVSGVSINRGYASPTIQMEVCE